MPAPWTDELRPDEQERSDDKSAAAKLTTHDCALNAAASLHEAVSASTDDGRRNFHLGAADMWMRLLDTMTRAGMGVAEREQQVQR